MDYGLMYTQFRNFLIVVVGVGRYPSGDQLGTVQIIHNHITEEGPFKDYIITIQKKIIILKSYMVWLNIL